MPLFLRSPGRIVPFASLISVLACQGLPGLVATPIRNELRNADLAAWTLGESAAPDGWALRGPVSGSIRVGAVIPQTAAFSALVSSAGGDVALYQDLLDARSMRGHSVRFTAWVRTSSASSVQLIVDSGGQLFVSPWHSGSNSWELLTAEGTVPDGATTSRFQAWATNATMEVGSFHASVDPAPLPKLRNLDLAAWTNGDVAAPDGWVFGGAGSGAIRRGAARAPGSAFSALVTGKQGDVALYQDLPDARRLRGHRLRFAAWVRSAAADSAHLVVAGRSAWFPSAWHSGNGTWELLTATGTVPKDTIDLRFHAWARDGSSLELGGCSMWIEPDPRTGPMSIALGALGFVLVLGLLFRPSRRRLISAGCELIRAAQTNAILGRARRWITPERFLLVAGSVFGFSFLMLTPPLQSPDEPAHFFRAYAVSEGHLLPEVRMVDGKPVPGADLPKSVTHLQDVVGRWEIPFHPDRKFDPQLAVKALSIPLRPRDRAFSLFGSTSMYAPIPYLPQAFAILAGRVAGLSPLLLLYLARIANLIVWLAGMWLAIRIAPVFKWGFALLALSPMSVFMAGTASADVATNWLSFLTTAAFLSCAFRDDHAKIGARELGRLLLLCVLLSACKQAYFLLSLLFLLVPVSKMKNVWRYAAALAFTIGLQVGVNLIWWYLAMRGHPVIREGSNPGQQMAMVLWDPLRFLGIFLRTHIVYWNFYLYSFVGNLGWLDVVLPSWSIVSYLSVALISCCFFGVKTGLLTLRHRALLLFIAAIIWVMVLGYNYVTWTKLGAGLIDGGMGRYLIPLSPLAFLAISGGRTSSSGEPIKLRLAGVLSVILFTALVCTVHRYYKL
jgi:uncharacterized membrane protein